MKHFNRMNMFKGYFLKFEADKSAKNRAEKLVRTKLESLRASKNN